MKKSPLFFKPFLLKIMILKDKCDPVVHQHQSDPSSLTMCGALIVAWKPEKQEENTDIFAIKTH